MTEDDPCEVTEHAVRLTDGSYTVRNGADYAEEIYPLARWIEGQQRHGGRVYQRKIIVIEEWRAVPRRRRRKDGGK